MKILVFGSGVIGSIYAARLFEANYDVTLLARGKRYEHLRQDGVTLRDLSSGKRITCTIPLIQELKADDPYDLIIVAVRLDQLEPVIPILKGNRVCPLIMLMLNNPEGLDHLTKELAPKKIILAFPGAGGVCRDGFVDYIQLKQQKTTLGGIKETGGIKEKDPACLEGIKIILEKAGFEVEVSTDMQAWLKTHAVFISCVAAAMTKENGDSIQLGKKKTSVVLMIDSIREGFSACKNLGIPILPTNIKIIFRIMPRWFSVLYWQHALKGTMGTLAMAPHVNAARDEMQLLAKKVLTMVHSSSIPTPTLDKLLLSFI